VNEEITLMMSGDGWRHTLSSDSLRRWGVDLTHDSEFRFGLVATGGAHPTPPMRLVGQTADCRLHIEAVDEADARFVISRGVTGSSRMELEVVARPGGRLQIFRSPEPESDEALVRIQAEVASSVIFSALTVPSSQTRLQIDGELKGRDARIHILMGAVGSGVGRLQTRIHLKHLAESTVSRQIIRQILTEKSHAAFQGRIEVEESAQRTDAEQSAKSLLLSDEATSVHQPELRIFADDVKAKHGSATGGFDRESIFFLEARGLREHEAKSMLVRSFVAETFSGLTDSSLALEARRSVNEAIDCLSQGAL
jgi:Fe-S cluster assembly protein SufD